jgi:hypothetical protein
VIALALAGIACSNDAAPPPAALAFRPPKEDPETAAPPPPLPCPHPYLPLVEGARWEHSRRSGRSRTRVTTTIGRLEKSASAWRAPVEIESGDDILRGAAECTADGAFADLVALHAAAETGDLRVASDARSAGHEGPLVPHGAAFAPDAAWTLGLATLVSAGDSLTKRSTVRSEMRVRRVADERVETPAGAYDAAHLVAEATSTEEAVLMGRTVPPRTLAPWRVEVWLAEGVGLVRSSVVQGDERIEWLLTEVEIP